VIHDKQIMPCQCQVWTISEPILGKSRVIKEQLQSNIWRWRHCFRNSLIRCYQQMNNWPKWTSALRLCACVFYLLIMQNHIHNAQNVKWRGGPSVDVAWNAGGERPYVLRPKQEATTIHVGCYVVHGVWLACSGTHTHTHTLPSIHPSIQPYISTYLPTYLPTEYVVFNPLVICFFCTLSYLFGISQRV